MIDPSLPLIDLHRHLDGNVRLSTIVELADRHGLALPARTAEGLRPYVVIEDRAADLMDFIGRFEYLTRILVDADACYRVGYENVLDAAEEGIDYLELRFSPWFMAESHGLDPREVVEACADGVAAGVRETGVPAKLIGIISRTYGVEVATRELDALLACRDRLVAIDLAGDEVNFPAADFAAHFRRARDAGLHVTVHAGEAAGPASVWSAIRDLGAERIGHGIHSGEDPALVDYLIEHRVGLEISLTSNVHISAVADYAHHPLADFLRQGVVANINTDDPAISGIDLRHEYEVAARRAGLDALLARQAQGHALEMAFLSPSEREQLLAGRADATP